MDPEGIGNPNTHPYDEEISPPAKKARPSPSISHEGGSVFLADLLMSRMATMVQVEVNKALRTYIPPRVLEELWKIKVQEEVTKDDEKEKYKLGFLNKPIPTLFTNNEIKGEDGNPLRVAIFYVRTNAIVSTGSLSTARAEFFLLDGDYDDCFGQQYNALSPRVGKRPLMVGKDLNINLQNGVGYISSLSITDNSSWTKSKNFRLGVKIKDEMTNIGIGVSKPFRVRDHRGEVNKKHHPPSREDPVYRLEGVGKDGAYHKNLSLHGIQNVGDFLKGYENMGPASLKKLLGNKVSRKKWEMMVSNAKECVDLVNYEQTSKVNKLPYKVMGDEPPFNQGFEDYELKSNLGYVNSQTSGLVFAEDFEYGLGYGADFSPSLTGDVLAPNTIKDFGQSYLRKLK